MPYCKPAPTSYEEATNWKSFQEYFPEETRIKEGEEPTEEFWEWKDYAVHLDRYTPDGVPNPVKIILVHGGGANGRLMFPIGVTLRRNGYACVAPDFPGFGLTKIRKRNSYETWIELLVDLIEKEHLADDRNVVLCGISLGGMLSYEAATASPYVKGIMVTALADTRIKKIQSQLARNKVMGFLGLNFLHTCGCLFDWAKIPIRYTTKMWAMANNKSFVRKLVRDKVGSGSKVYIKFLRTLFEAAPEIEPEDFATPVLFLQPEKDKLMPWWVSSGFYERLACPKELVVLLEAGHIPIEQPGVSQLEEACLRFLANIYSSLQERGNS